MRHYLSELDLSAAEFRAILARAGELRRAYEQGETEPLFPRRVLGMIFEKSSTRTRISFEAGMAHLGGHAIFLSSNDTQMGRGEPPADTARVLSQMVDIVSVRTFSHSALENFASHSTIPVINALTDLLHPCQLLADMQTWFDRMGDIQGRQVAWIGDGNNMCNSYINAAKLLDFELTIACPDGYEPDATLMANAGSHATRTDDPAKAMAGADLVVTDVWASMGQESEQQARETAFKDFCVTEALMATASPEVLFMHCLPAHRGEEVAAEVIDGPHSVVWDEAGNRLHAQKALIEFLLNAAD